MRTEPAGFPLISGNSDTGVQVGVVGTLSRFASGIAPYRWNMDLLLAASFKFSHGFQLTQESVLWNIDVPRVAMSDVRILPAAGFKRTINRGYFGIGNGTSDVVPANVTGDPNRFFQFKLSELQVRSVTRIRAGRGFDWVPLLIYRYDVPTAYPGSKLEQDALTPAPGTPPVFGLQNMSLVTIGAGFIYDTRDNEIFPRSGFYHQVAIKYIQGFPFDANVNYGQASASLVGFFPFGSEFVFASRVVFDWQFGHVPFFDLLTGGPFKTQEMPGGSAGVRGVPIGRYLGPIKVLANEEVRGMLVDFHLFGQYFHVGADTFFDTGRVFADGTFVGSQDGSGLGLKFGVGGGGYLQWGQAAIFRAEFAYSPSARAISPNFPIGVYVEDNTMF